MSGADLGFEKGGFCRSDWESAQSAQIFFINETTSISIEDGWGRGMWENNNHTQE